MSDCFNIKVLTFNVWGIPIIAKKKNERLIKIGEELIRKQFDITALQEVWMYSDFIRIRDALKSRYIYAHYFHSGLVGSGCCVFSVFPISQVYDHAFTLNGYPYKIWHGDWYAGK
ncbi:hypothetical protein GJ496_009100 [Pomphorhynchus laevis]|nr:hypothetical protein GJ496_009100 [Pomphorhynchus laevis]